MKAIINKNTKATVAILSLLAFGALSATVPDFKIVSISAYLFYNHSGTFSENLIDNEDFILWNIVIGEGSAAEPSDATLVVVEVKGTPGSYEIRQVELIAGAGEQVILSETSEIGVLGEDGIYRAGFWLYGTGCLPVKLAAAIKGQTKESKLEKVIDFACGE